MNYPTVRLKETPSGIKALIDFDSEGDEIALIEIHELESLKDNCERVLDRLQGVSDSCPEASPEPSREPKKFYIAKIKNTVTGEELMYDALISEDNYLKKIGLLISVMETVENDAPAGEVVHLVLEIETRK